MKYQYRFSTGTESIELDEAWVEVLRTFDKQEFNSDRQERGRTVHYDGIGYEPEFMGKEDERLATMFDGSPAFEYAVNHLLPKHWEILYRRAIRGEKYADIGQTYDISASAVYHYYRNVQRRFMKYYEEGTWLSSKGAANAVRSIPFGLTPAQVMAIRAYRYEFKSLREIADLVGVPRNRVKQCLHQNPVLETKCPACGTLVSQSVFGQMRVFCSSNCYYKWFRTAGLKVGTAEGTMKKKPYLDSKQMVAIDYYRQRFLSLAQIRQLTGVSEQILSAYIYANPLPYTLCQTCGIEVPGSAGERVKKYCSKQCRDIYGRKVKKERRKASNGNPEKNIPPVEQLYYALDLREAGRSDKKIARLTGLSNEDVSLLFRFLNRRKTFLLHE